MSNTKLGTVQYIPKQWQPDTAYDYVPNQEQTWILYNGKAWVTIGIPIENENPEEGAKFGRWECVATFGESASIVEGLGIIIDKTDPTKVIISLNTILPTEIDISNGHTIDPTTGKISPIKTILQNLYNNSLPPQLNKKGSFLTTNGSSASWEQLPVSSIKGIETMTAVTEVADDGKGNYSISVNVEGTPSEYTNSVIINTESLTEAGKLYGITGAGVQEAHGIKNRLKLKPFVLDIKSSTKILCTSLLYDGYAINNYCYIENGHIYFFCTRVEQGYEPILTGSPVTKPCTTNNFDFVSYTVGNEDQLLIASYVNSTTGNLEVQVVRYLNGNLTFMPVQSTKIKPTDSNVTILQPKYGTAAKKEWMYILYWTDRGLCTIPYRMSNQTIVSLESLLTPIENGKGEIIVGNTPKVSYITSKVFDRRLILCWTSPTGIIEAKYKNTNIVDFDVANLTYDEINNALLVTYILAEDVADSQLSNQACANLYDIDTNKNLIKLSKLVRLNSWVLPETDTKKVNIQVMQTGTSGQYIWFLRNPKGQLSMVGFCTAPNNTILKGAETIAYRLSGTATGFISATNFGAIGLTNGNGFDLVLLSSAKTPSQTYEQWIAPSVSPSSFLGQAVDDTGNVKIKGMLKLNGNFKIGGQYYLQWKEDVEDGSYEFTTSSTSGLYIGNAINYSALVY